MWSGAWGRWIGTALLVGSVVALCCLPFDIVSSLLAKSSEPRPAERGARVAVVADSGDERLLRAWEVGVDHLSTGVVDRVLDRRPRPPTPQPSRPGTRN